MKHILSASRRTDIPAYYSEWLINRLKDGYAYVRNPYGGNIYKVSLRSEDILCIVLWSKNFSPLIRRLDSVEKKTHNIFFHFTITGMPKDLEQHTPPLKEAIHDFIYLSKRYSPKHLIWRFDPICITDKLPFTYFEEMFAACAEMLTGHCNKCYISFVQKYKKAVVNFKKYSDHRMAEIYIETQRAYASRLSGIAEKNGIKLYSCCNDHLLSDSVHKGSCINSSSLAALFHDPGISSPVNPTRNQCACVKSIDIGTYNTCPHGCLYCYANADKEQSQKSFQQHNTSMNGLGFHVEEETGFADQSHTSLLNNEKE